jgi:hypothetical protein
MWRRVGGKVVEREATCECGRAFMQMQISKRFAKLMSERALHIFKHHCPDGFVPCNCPPCERKALASMYELYAKTYAKA